MNGRRIPITRQIRASRIDEEIARIDLRLTVIAGCLALWLGILALAFHFVR